MKRRITILAGGALLFLLGVGIGYLLGVPGPASGAGRFQKSPDGKWVAFANTLDDGPVLGRHRTYSKFTIQTSPPSPHTVRSMTVEDSATPPIDWREDGSILWASNSSSVTFKGDARPASLEITLKVLP
jgi:hypothetical protein